jgi:hypothetical protein
MVILSELAQRAADLPARRVLQAGDPLLRPAVELVALADLRAAVSHHCSRRWRHESRISGQSVA